MGQCLAPDYDTSTPERQQETIKPKQVILRRLTADRMIACCCVMVAHNPMRQTNSMFLRRDEDDEKDGSNCLCGMWTTLWVCPLPELSHRLEARMMKTFVVQIVRTSRSIEQFHVEAESEMEVRLAALAMAQDKADNGLAFLEEESAGLTIDWVSESVGI